MKTSNRLLLWFGAAIGVLVIVTVALVIGTTRGNSVLLPENTPEGTVQRFLLAIEQRDYAKAYSYLALDEKGQPVPYEDWVQSLPPSVSADSSWKATIDKSTVRDSDATVDVTISVFRPRGPFNDPVFSNRVSFTLKKVGASWRITSRPYLYFLW